MTQNKFHNTIGLTGDALREAVAKASKQEDSILLIFLNTRKAYTASQITHLTTKAGRSWPIWSNRRALTNLKTSGDLVKTEVQKISPQGKPEHFYQLNPRKHPTPVTSQQSTLSL